MILSDFLKFNFQELPNTFSVEYNQDFSDFKADLFYNKTMMKTKMHLLFKNDQRLRKKADQRRAPQKKPTRAASDRELPAEKGPRPDKTNIEKGKSEIP